MTSCRTASAPVRLSCARFCQAIFLDEGSWLHRAAASSRTVFPAGFSLHSKSEMSTGDGSDVVPSIDCGRGRFLGGAPESSESGSSSGDRLRLRFLLRWLLGGREEVPRVCSN